ncbi:hypothetical protein CEXT_34651 [Caerostris extrusa]|uniref:Uncharacterized protein n=1 Tax=Caerostris extrusa TaxID=172846 RepID=A0AAV4VUZ3_CAEEX|nr:hypothetical protein CEXT_34651 [Caerostris extrusa]
MSRLHHGNFSSLLLGIFINRIFHNLLQSSRNRSLRFHCLFLIMRNQFPATVLGEHCNREIKIRDPKCSWREKLRLSRNRRRNLGITFTLRCRPLVGALAFQSSTGRVTFALRSTIRYRFRHGRRIEESTSYRIENKIENAILND